MLLFAALLAASPPVKIIEIKSSTGTIAPVCRNPEARTVAGNTGPGVHPLNAEPSARHLYAVVRIDVDGCNKPMVIADRVGASKR